MWMVFVGADGVAKNKIAEALVKDGWQWRVPAECQFKFSENTFAKQIEYLSGRFRLQHQIQKVMAEEDILTVRSLWDVCAVYSSLMLEMNFIQQWEADVLEMISEDLAASLSCPHLIIYLKARKSDAFNRMAMRQVRSVYDNEYWWVRLDKAYDEYVKRIRVSNVEVDVSRDFADVMNDVKAAIDSVKSTTFMSKTIWQKSFFK